MGPLFAGAFMPLDFVSSVAISTLLTGVLSALAYWKGVLTWDGSLAAFVVGMVIGIFGDVTWLFLLLFFLLSSFLATRYRFALKEALGVQEGTRGERRAANVLANGAAPMFVAGVSMVMPAGFPKIISGIIFLSALSVAGADTLASEIGVLSKHTYLITNRKPVPAGTDGGVSRLGQLCAIGAAAYTSSVGWFVLSVLARGYGFESTMPANPAYLVIPAVIGFLGCQLDSVIGATLEQRGLVSKKVNNLISTSAGAMLAFARSGVRPSAYTRKIGSVPDGRTRTEPSRSRILTPSVVSTGRPFASPTSAFRTASRFSTGTATFAFLMWYAGSAARSSERASRSFARSSSIFASAIAPSRQNW